MLSPLRAPRRWVVFGFRSEQWFSPSRGGSRGTNTHDGDVSSSLDAFRRIPIILLCGRDRKRFTRVSWRASPERCGTAVLLKRRREDGIIYAEPGKTNVLLSVSMMDENVGIVRTRGGITGRGVATEHCMCTSHIVHIHRTPLVTPLAASVFIKTKTIRDVNRLDNRSMKTERWTTQSRVRYVSSATEAAHGTELCTERIPAQTRYSNSIDYFGDSFFRRLHNALVSSVSTPPLQCKISSRLVLSAFTRDQRGDAESVENAAKTRFGSCFSIRLVYI